MHADAPIPSLRRSALILLGCLPVMLALGRWLWGVDDTTRLVVSVGLGWLAVAGPLLIAGLQTRHRLGRGRPAHFEPFGLERAMRFGAGALVSFLALGIFGVLIAVPLIVVAAAMFARSWVQPREEDLLLTRLVAATVPFLLFIGGLNIDERPLLGAVLFTMAVSGLLRLWMLRKVALAKK